MRAIKSIGIALVLLAVGSPVSFARKRDDSKSEQMRSQYIDRIQQQTVSASATKAPGSLWSADGPYTNMAADYKASRLNDTIVIQVIEQTTATSSGNVNSQRSFDTSSGITGLAGHLTPQGVNPILKANSATNLKGQGQAAAASNLRTSLSGQIIAVLPNGNLVVEAERQIAIHNQRETMILRGVLRPGDVTPENTVASTALSDLEIELKGKGIISDSTRPPNPLLRRLLWLVGF